ncbi:MAG TPA: winged helix-turn-helix domain-containing protein [Candidatus Sulfomarinibacteraceae bacterium]|nr:winged helix-turn-helix domain-containing protein [Candidatus Sulfomarinibacteraceae bacterium]
MPLAPRRRARSNVFVFPERITPPGRYNGRTVPITDAQPIRRRLERFRLGEWLVVPAEGRLIAGEETRRLEPRTMDVLVCLAERAGAVVSKNALIDAVWAGGYISEGTLTNAVAELRAALGDDARHPRFVETIPKRGYRLLVQPQPEEPGEPMATSPASSRRRRMRWLAAAALVLTAGLASVLILRPVPPAPDPHRVLVVPLVNRSGDPGLDALCALAADRLSAGLSSSGLAEALPVHDLPAAPDITAISAAARERGSGLAIAGAVYLHEGDVEVQIRLVDANKAQLLYAVPAEIAPREGLDEALDRTVDRALGAVATHLIGHAHNNLLSRPPLFEAHREFVAGSVLWGVDYPEAVRHLERAAALDPGFVSPQLRLAMGYRVLGRPHDAAAVISRLQQRRQDLTEFEQLWVDAFDAWVAGRIEDRLRFLRRIEVMVPEDFAVKQLIAVSALALNRPREALDAFGEVSPGDAPAWIQHAAFFASVYQTIAAAYHRIGRHADELEAARAGLRRFPSHRRLREIEARALAAMGDREGLERTQAITETTGSGGLDPCHYLVEATASARAHGHQTLTDELVARTLRALESRARADDDPELLWIRARSLVYRGELDGARQVLEDLRSRFPNHASLEAARWLGMVAARQGDTARAAEVEAELVGMAGQRTEGSTTYSRAAIAAWLGHRDRALELLREAQREGWGSFSLFHDTDRILFEPLLGMPEYEAMLHPTG